MWILLKHPFVEGGDDCDINLSGDASISRKHAEIKVSATGESKLTITDLSKIGVQLNASRISSKVETALNEGDILGFGRSMRKFRIEHFKMSAVMSCISSSHEKTRIKQHVQRLGGLMTNEWETGSTILVMEKLTFTIKVVCALACGRLVVTPKYFEDMIDSCDKKKGFGLPDQEHYLPPIGEASLKGQEPLFCLNEKRKTLLTGKLFVTLAEKQYKRMKQAIGLAGGDIILHANPDKDLFRRLTCKQTIVLKLETKEEQSLSKSQLVWMNDVYSKVKSHHLRLVRESEIGLAILHVSIESFCNPITKSPPSLSGTTHTQVLSDTMATETQNIQRTQEPVRKVTESLKNQTSEHGPVAEKRKHAFIQSSSSEDESLFKKPKIQPIRSNRVTRNSHIISESNDESEEAENEFSFKLANNTVSASSNSHQTGTSGTTNKEIVLEHDSVTSEVFERQVEENHATPLSKKPIPDTFPSTAFEKETSQDVDVKNQKKPDDFEHAFDEDDPFSFSIPESNNQDNLSKVVRGVIGNTPSQPHDQSLELPGKLNGRFSKAVASSQESNSGNVLMSDEDGNLVPKRSTENALKNIGLVSPAAPIKTEWETPIRSDEESNLPHSNLPNISKQSRPDDLSYLLNDDDFVSEEYSIPAAQKDVKMDHTIRIDGFISTVNKRSTVKEIKVDPDLADIDRDLVKTELKSLVVQSKVNEHVSRTYKPSSSKTKAKNFKTFRKQMYAGQSSCSNTITPKIVDFAAFESQNEERNNLFDELREENDRDEEEQGKFDNMFDFSEPKGKTGKTKSRKW